MEMHISQGFIMRIREFGESDLLVTFFTADKGRLKGVAKGARRSRKRFANCLDLFCLTNLEYGLQKKGGLYFLNSCKLINGFSGLRSDFSSLSLASYMVELTEILFPQNVVDKNMFCLLKESFALLDGKSRNDVLRIVFEAKVMTLGGYGINFGKCCRCGRPYTGAGRAVFMRDRGAIACLNCEEETAVCPGMAPDVVKELQALQTITSIDLENVNLTEGRIREIRPVLKLHMEYRLGKRLRSAKYLE
jgi:DNA repair protein RecO (recombination protein O)